MINIDTIQDLLQSTSEKVLSLYLHTDSGYQPNQSEKPAWQIYVKNALRGISDASDDETYKAIKTHTDAFFEGYVPSGKSLVLFITSDGVAQQFELPVAVDNHHAFGEPDVVPLIWTIDEYERYLVVLVDEAQARFMSAYLGSATVDDEMSLDFEDYDFGNKQFIHANHSSSADNLQGSGGDQFDDMKDEHIRRFHDDVAQQIREFMRDMNSDRIILGGSEQAAHQVKRLMHESVQNQLVEILSLPVDSSVSEVADAIRSSAINYERSQELDLVNEVINFAKSGGRGALGVDNVRQALEHQQVELLILPYPMDDESLARELTLMAVEAGTDLEMVRGSSAAKLQGEGNIAARLYYAVPETN